MLAAIPTSIANTTKPPPNAGLSSSFVIVIVNSSSTMASPSDTVTSYLASVVWTYISRRL